MKIIVPTLLASAVLAATAGAGLAVADDNPCRQPDQGLNPVVRDQPPYPHAARTFCLEGWFRTEFVVQKDGSVRDVRVIDGQPTGAFDLASQAIYNWQFVPACRDGQAIDRRATQVVEFELDPDIRQNCPSDLDEDTRALLEELGASYAELAKHLLHRPNDPLPTHLTNPPPPRHSGDLGEVEAFHDRAIERITRSRQAGIEQLRATDIHALFDASRFYLDRSLEETAGILERLQEFNAERMESLQQLQAQLHLDRAELEARTSFPDQFFNLLIGPLLEDPEREQHAGIAWQRMNDLTLVRLEQLVGFLHQTRGLWQAEGSDFRFTNSEDQRHFDTTLKAIQRLQLEALSEQQRLLQGIWDYF
jgi:TonB family protein